MKQWSSKVMTQRINQLVNQWIDESWWINESVTQWITGSMNQWINESLNQWINEWINWWMIQPINKKWIDMWYPSFWNKPTFTGLAVLQSTLQPPPPAYQQNPGTLQLCRSFLGLNITLCDCVCIYIYRHVYIHIFKCHISHYIQRP